MPALPSKDRLMAAFALAVAGAVAFIEHTFQSEPDAGKATDKVLDYLQKEFGPDLISRAVSGAIPELVALAITGKSEVRKSDADLG